MPTSPSTTPTKPVPLNPTFTDREIKLLLKNLHHYSPEEQEEIYKIVEELEAQNRAQAAFKDLIEFCKLMQPDYKVGKHHRILANLLMQIERGKKPGRAKSRNGKDRVCVNIPPRHGKSQLVSIYFPAWFLGRNPDKKVMMVSHTTDLAVDFGRKVRNLISTPTYQSVFPNVQLSQDSKSAGRWNTSQGGEYYACGIGSSIAGRGAHLLLVDDPHALEITTPIPTPNGFVEMQDLRVGDEVFGPDGVPTKVVAKSEVYHDRPLYSAVTSDGEEVLCDGKHLWGVNSDTNLSKARTVNYTAEYIANWPKANRPVLPRHQAVEYPERDLPIDPWVLGAWLGDGTSSSGRITADPKTGDQAYMIEQFQTAGYEVGEVTPDGWTFTVYGLMPQLRALGVLNNKHVPEQYLTSSVDQRLALLQGLMDTDGSVLPSGQAGFYNCNEGLVRAVVEILHSLGVRAQLRTYEDRRGRWGSSKPNHRVMFRLADCARMPRKLQYTRTPTDKRGRSIEIEDTGRTGSVQCITVAREDGLFLAGRGYVVTHNSEQDVLNGNFEVFDKAYEWFTYGARTRLMPQGRVAIIQTRWHMDDLTGRVTRDMAQNDMADQYEVVEFPAILEVEDEGTPGKIIEKPLWPEFFDLDALHRTKASMPLFQWNAQYQQKPTAEEAALVKREWWNEWPSETPPKCEYIIVSLDAAAEKHNRADYTAITVWGVFRYEGEHKDSEGKTIGVADTYNIILLNSIRVRVEFPELKQLAHKQYTEWDPDAFIVEKKSSGTPLYQELRRMGLVVQEYTPHRGTGDKTARLNSVADIVMSGLCWVPQTRWAEEVVEEIAGFPFMSHDDLVDSTVMALMRFRQGGFIRLPSDEQEPERYFKRRNGGYY